VYGKTASNSVTNVVLNVLHVAYTELHELKVVKDLIDINVASSDINRGNVHINI
jgi:hypothetical protein